MTPAAALEKIMQQVMKSKMCGVHMVGSVCYSLTGPTLG